MKFLKWVRDNFKNICEYTIGIMILVIMFGYAVYTSIISIWMVLLIIITYCVILVADYAISVHKKEDDIKKEHHRLLLIVILKNGKMKKYVGNITNNERSFYGYI